MLRLHATAIALDIDGQWRGVLLRGPSGSGKSDLALRLIDGGARLVADDQCEVACANGALVAAAVPALAGLLEVRGLGIMQVPALPSAALVLLVDLVAPGDIARYPAPVQEEILGVGVPRLALAPFESSAVAKLRLAVAAVESGIIRRQHSTGWPADGQ